MHKNRLFQSYISIRAFSLPTRNIPTVCADFYICFCFHSWWKPSSDTWCGVCCPAGCDRARALHRRKVQISLSSSSAAAEGGCAEPELYYVLVILLVFM